MSNRRDNVLSPQRRYSRRGFTLVELLVGMALLVMIMTAVALAMQGAADAAGYGRDKARSLTQAALALGRLSADIRRAAEVDLDSSHVVNLTLPDGRQRQYAWNPVPGDPLIFASSQNPDGNTLVPEVVDFTLTARNEYSEIAGDVVPVSVHVVLEVRYGGAATRLETTVRPRRNIL